MCAAPVDTPNAAKACFIAQHLFDHYSVARSRATPEMTEFGESKDMGNNQPGLNRDMELVLKVIKLLSARNLPLNQKLDQSLGMILDGINAENGSIMINSDDRTELKVWAATNKRIIGKKQGVSTESISGQTFLSSQPVLIKNINDHPQFAPKSRPGNYRTNSLISVPLKNDAGDTAFGVINASDHRLDSSFSRNDLNLLLDYSAWISPILNSSLLMEDLKREKEKYRQLSFELEIKQKELMISTAERSELVQMVVHDFKSPLSAVISNLELLSYMEMSRDQRPVIATALDGSQKLLEMINDFLQLARLDQWQESDQTDDIFIKDMVQQEVENILPTAKAKSISVEVVSDHDLKVRAHNSMLHHLLNNLLTNAVKYTPDNGTVKISWIPKQAKRITDKCSSIVELCVEDSGQGVPDQMKKAIFERFYRAAGSSHIQGTGVGLYISNRIANLMGGKIWVEDAVPHGSRFCVTMPSAEVGHAR